MVRPCGTVVVWSVQVMAEQARRLGIVIEEQPRQKSPSRSSAAPAKKKPRDLGGALEISTIHRRVRNFMKAQGSSPPESSAAVYARLPPGWEERIDLASGRTFFIDHNTKVSDLITAREANDPDSH